MRYLPFGCIVFTDQRRKFASQIVYSNDVELTDIINTAAEYKKALSEMYFTTSENESPDLIEMPLRNLYYAATSLKSDIENAEGINLFPLNPNYILQENLRQSYLRS